MLVSVCPCTWGFLSLTEKSFSFLTPFCDSQIVGNGSEQQLQKELEDVLMDPPMEDQPSDRDHGEDSRADGEGEEPVILEASASSTINPVSVAGPQKPEMSLPVKPAQGG